MTLQEVTDICNRTNRATELINAEKLDPLKTRSS